MQDNPDKQTSTDEVQTEYKRKQNKKNSVRGHIFHTRPDQPWSPPSLLCNEYQLSFPGVKRPGRGLDTHPHLASRLKKE